MACAVPGKSKIVYESQGGGEGSSGAVDSPENAHFLAICSKLIYENERIVRDVIERKWVLKSSTQSIKHVRNTHACFSLLRRIESSACA